MVDSKDRILLCSRCSKHGSIIILAVILTYLLATTAKSDNNDTQVHATAEKTTGSTTITIFPSITSHDILAKVLIDNAIQAIQDGNRNMTIERLIAANQELASVLESENSSVAIEPKLIVEYLVELLQNGTGGITNNKALVYLNLADSYLGDMLNESNTNTTILRDSFLTSTNQRYEIKMQYPYYWSIDGNTYPAGKIGVQVASFFLPSSGSDLPIVSIGIDNLSKTFRHQPVYLDEYLHLSLTYKNSTGFPGFKLIQSKVNNNASNNTLTLSTRNIFRANNAYSIIWTYNHTTYGIRKSIGLGTIMGGNKGFFIDYTTSTTKFLKYLPIIEKMITSFAIAVPAK